MTQVLLNDSAGSAKTRAFMPADGIRAQFSAAMSAMYRDEVPQYGTLLDLVAEVNAAALRNQPGFAADANASARLQVEMHGAIRVGTESELHNLRRMFAVMGMFPVGYYDLSVAGVPVHATAFRPVTSASLAANPFRVFTSLLRLDLIQDKALRELADGILRSRSLLTPAICSPPPSKSAYSSYPARPFTVARPLTCPCAFPMPRPTPARFAMAWHACHAPSILPSPTSPPCHDHYPYLLPSRPLRHPRCRRRRGTASCLSH